MATRTQLTPNDLPLLRFLWKWKLSTTSALHLKFYPSRSRATTYHRLWKLEKAGYIRSRFDEAATHSIWALDKRGFTAIKDRLPILKEQGFLPSNWGHDLLVSAIHLGESIFRELPNVETFSEQELRRRDPDYYPSWVPKHKEYRPDGYWRVKTPDGYRIIALEVELTQKRDFDYEAIGWKYMHDESDFLLWIVPRLSLANTIQEQLEKSRFKKTKANFVLLNSIYEKGWFSPIVLGSEAGKSIYHLLSTSPQSASNLVFSQFSLDTRKKADISKPPQIYQYP